MSGCYNDGWCGGCPEYEKCKERELLMRKWVIENKELNAEEKAYFEEIREQHKKEIQKLWCVQ